jgi:Domain of unknown function (DUF4307)
MTTLAHPTDERLPPVASTTSTAGTPVYPPGRYGRRRDPVRLRRRRLVTIGLAVLVGLAGAAVAVKLFNQYERAPYQVSEVATTAVTDTSVTVSFDLTVPAGSGASCTAVAQTRTGAVVGSVEVPVPAPAAGQTTAHVTYTIPTTQRAFAATVPGCGPPQ